MKLVEIHNMNLISFNAFNFSHEDLRKNVEIIRRNNIKSWSSSFLLSNIYSLNNKEISYLDHTYKEYECTISALRPLRI